MTKDNEHLVKSNRHLRLKTGHGKSINVVREVYRRDDIPCQSRLCLAGCPNDKDDLGLLPANITHYVIPDCQIAREYLEIFETPEITGIIFLQTVANSVQHEGNRRLHNRLKNIVRDKRKNSILFHNEFQKYAYCERQPGEPLAAWQSRSTYKATDWFFNHLAGQKPVVMVTQNKQILDECRNKTLNVFVMALKEYLDTFWKVAIPGLMDLYESITASLETKIKGKDYVGYLPSDVLEAGLKSGQFIQGFINVNKSNVAEEAFVKRKRRDMKEDSEADILIHGKSSRNRAVHGDLVIVELLPRSEWRGRSLVIREEKQEKEDTAETDDTEESEESSNVMPTGQVIGIVQRKWREYVATFAQNELQGTGGNVGKVLVIPWDYRIPKIRISTRQADTLKDQRIVVRIDSWDVDSQYPNGHFVRSLGKMGDLETEISAILVENSILLSSFSDVQMKELPVDTPEHPWKVEAEEISKRRDLRDTHLVFSIDPKGCEDVDDTLSVRCLDNGHIELGVHIADVTHFVKPGSLTDQEAKSRSTTVYLADRRYDMLPGVLSANLCSLISGVDRYAVSVMWELDQNYEVIDVWFGKTIIRSRYKLFYEIAQAMHDGISMAEIIQNVPELQNIPEENVSERVEELKSSVNKLMEIARYLKARRVKGGALELESVEVQVQLTETKSIADLTPKDHLEIHETIAECMIFANHWVAKKIAEVFPNSALLRHHPLPKDEQFGNLISCAAAKGFTINTTTNKELADSLDKCVVPGDPEANKLMRTLATMAMSNAAYFSTGSLSRTEFFHYGLALDLYTHFTSPIRRYADVVVHRQLMAAVEYQDKIGLPGNVELDELTDHINHKHRASQNAQRDSQELFQCLFFKDKLTDDQTCIVDAIIFQLRANGIFVVIPRYGIKGPVYLRSKEGQVLYINTDGQQEWTGGTITKTDQSVIVNSMYGTQIYTLLDHITVKISLNDSWAHSASTRIDIVSDQRYMSKTLTDDTAKQQKAAIIKEVSAAAEEKRSQLNSYELGANFEQLKAEYGQTSSENNLYELFESFKESALCS